MSSEPDSTPRRRPPTIDLTATEIETEQPASEAGMGGRGDGGGPPKSFMRWNFAGRVAPHAIGAVAGAAVVAAIGLGLWLVGAVPSRNEGAPATGNGTAGLSAQLDKIQAELQKQPPDSALASRLATLEAQSRVLGETLAGVNRRLDDVAVAAQGARERADAASQLAQGAAQTSVQRSDIDALAGRIAALEGAVKTLAGDVAGRAASADDRSARAAVAAEALRAVVERGAPYTAELAAVKSFGADSGAAAALDPFAGAGVPSAGDLAHELLLLTPALLQASGAASSDGSFLGRLESNAKNLVRITPIDAPVGDEPASVVARLNADALRADIAAALADIARLPPAAKALAQSWMQKAQARDAAIAASRRIAANALAALGNANTQ